MIPFPMLRLNKWASLDWVQDVGCSHARLKQADAQPEYNSISRTGVSKTCMRKTPVAIKLNI